MPIFTLTLVLIFQLPDEENFGKILERCQGV
jgi:hypothetical protein